MSDRYESQGAALIQFYGWLRETGEIDRLLDLVIEKVRDANQSERAKDPESAGETAAFLTELLRAVVATGTKDPRLDARISEVLESCK